MWANGVEVSTLAQANEQGKYLDLEELKLEDFDGETQEAVDWAMGNNTLCVHRGR